MGIDEQRSNAARVGALYVRVNPSERAGIALGTLCRLPLNALRHPPENGTCGWYIWGGEEFSEDPDFFESLCVEHLPEYVPALVPYLGLGPGWRVLLAPNYEDVWFDEKLLAI
jgi:hypothetical protein